MCPLSHHSLIALLFTIVIMFSLKGELIVQIRWMWFESQFLCYLLYFDVCVEFHGGKYFADYSSTAIALQRANESLSQLP
jgi:ACR3 family arsenite transporter